MRRESGVGFFRTVHRLYRRVNRPTRFAHQVWNPDELQWQTSKYASGISGMGGATEFWTIPVEEAAEIIVIHGGTPDDLWVGIDG